MDEARGIIDEVQEALTEYLGEIELPVPSDQDVELVWAVIRRAAA